MIMRLASPHNNLFVLLIGNNNMKTLLTGGKVLRAHVDQTDSEISRRLEVMTQGMVNSDARLDNPQRSTLPLLEIDGDTIEGYVFEGQVR